MASATVAFNAIVVEALNQHNYKDWSSRVQTYLLAEDLWDVVKSAAPRPESKKKSKAWRTKDAKALHAIKISCGTEIFCVIRETKTAKKAWEVLENTFKSRATLYFEKKERDRSLHTANNAGPQTHEVEEELVIADEELASEGERDRSLHTANNAGQKREVGKEVALANEELEIKAGEGGNENVEEFHPMYGPFFGYVVKGNWDNAKDCLATLHPNAIRAKSPEMGFTALHFAASNGHAHIVKELVSLMRVEDLEIKDNDGYTALHKAVYKRNVDIVKHLVPLMKPEALSIKGKYGETVLHVVAKFKYDINIVKELVSLMRKEDLEIQDNNGCTALHNAVYNRNVDIVKHLVPLMRPEALRIKGKHGETALHVVAKFEHDINTVKELVSRMREEDLEIKDNDGCTALHNAVYNRNVDIVKQLVPLMRPEALRIKGKDGATALHVAASFGQLKIVKELVSLMREEDLEIQDNNGCTALHNAVFRTNVDIVKQLTALMRPEGLGLKNNNDETALHRAVSFQHDVNIVKELVSLMRKEDLEIKDDVGNTALGLATSANLSEGHLVQIARCMVEKNKQIRGITLANKVIPVVNACGWGKWEMCRYLYSVTPLEALLLEDGTQGALLISTCIRQRKGDDIAWDLLQRCPRLAIVDKGVGEPPMLTLARMRYAFLSGMQLTFLQKWIYNSIHVQPVDFNAAEISINVSKSKDDQGNQRYPICSVKSLYRRFVKGRLVKLLGINHIYEMKSTHIRVHDFLRCMGRMTRNMSTFTLAERNIVISSVFKAVEQGHVEFVIHLCKENPTLVDIFDEKQRNIFQYAIECRQEGIYNLIYGLEKEKRNKIGLSVTNFKNSMLHSAANLSPLTRIQGASLQMQRELQWFKEVESIVPVEKHEYLNFSDGLTARELFTKNHKKLKEEAEISMKGTATSCTTVGALIVTIMFAVAFTVPGGTNDDTGFPIFMHKKLFKVFIIADIISLASSSTSVITFLGILTSRYAEYDFLKSLPKKMMVGLSALFISIATMMVTFFCALTIMLDGEAWIIIPSIMFASVPVISFIWFLFPLLVEICKSTYGPGIFVRNLKRWY